MQIHKLKTDPKLFDDVWNGVKTLEVRFDDRDYEAGDYLLLRQTKFTGKLMKEEDYKLIYTGRYLLVKVLHIQDEIGMKQGWVALSLVVLDRGNS